MNFDFEGYIDFKSFVGRYDVLPNKIVELFREFEHPKKINIIDLGSGELTLLEKMNDALSKHYNTNCIAIDDSKDILGNILIKYGGSLPDFLHEFVQQDIEEYIKQNDGSWNLILLSHVIYHIPLSNWIQLIKRLQNQLAVNGKLFVVARSIKGEWWSIFENLQRKIEQFQLSTYRFSEDFEKALRETGINYHKTGVSYIGTVNNLSQLVNAFEFLYRLPSGYVEPESNLHKSIAFSAQNKIVNGDCQFGFIDEIFMISSLNE
ncbi:methyltransferase domain-containing protein [Aureisphaera galaxeae]|uniref:class I SAM-dependent methyltransferase n=1 Tax=Aureisphaera galaxeae TaxID=1538023 RepID=UPI0023502A0B|nr:methyltransferase domain-containing protein [Aureisphaera galaxeae]MDC8002841.1 methyltransferase domain-containing protein [Aureisphaera galaxeae]